MKKQWFKKIPILGLSPMADLTDSPFSLICRKVSGKDFVIFREMVSSEAIFRGNEKTFKMCEILSKERPVVIQLFGSSPQVMAKAAKIVEEKFSPDGIDINMGCPVPKITGKNLAGAALMKNVSLASEIVYKVKEAVNVPVSVKTRLGWAKNDEILSFSKELEMAGADLLSIHGRTKAQGYSGAASWEMIGRVKNILRIPVLANGDVVDKKSYEECMRVTGADGVLIGRGALGNPWIFSEVKNSIRQSADKIQSDAELKETILSHAKLHLEHYGKKYGLVTFRKHLLSYFKGRPGAKDVRLKLAKIISIEDLQMVLEE